MKPTQRRIDKEVERLREMRQAVLRQSIFGDNHRLAIDAQIDVLKNRLCDDLIYIRYAPREGAEGSVYERSVYVLAEALAALRWMDGGGSAPSAGWKELVRK